MMEGEKSATPAFRSAKRQKMWRKRTDDEEPQRREMIDGEATSLPTRGATHGLAQSSDADSAHNSAGGMADDQELSLAEIRQRQRLSKARKTGIAFTRTRDSIPLEVPESDRIESGHVTAVELANSRFVPQAGDAVLVKDVQDKHM
jgi:hypothetical protein